jgi:effector-binding domain-containing protein
VPAGKTELSQAVKIGQTPIGKAMRFEHRGAYDDIDATYDAITAYVDEKGIDAQDVFIEEYMTDLDSPDDPNTVVNIEVLLN